MKLENRVKAVREVIKTHKTQKQDMYDDTAELLKPSIDAQKSIKESVDEKQDKVIKQLQTNQKDIKKWIGKYCNDECITILKRTN